MSFVHDAESTNDAAVYYRDVVITVSVLLPLIILGLFGLSMFLCLWPLPPAADNHAAGQRLCLCSVLWKKMKPRRCDYGAVD